MRKSLVGATVAVVMVLSSACSVLTRDPEPEQPNRSRGAAAILDVVDWGFVEGLLSVRVVNNTDRTLERAEAVISIVKTNGVSLSAGASIANDTCCTVLSLPPEGHFGLYVDLGEEVRASDIDDIRVDYRAVSWSPAVDDALTTLEPTKIELEGGETDAVVTTMVRTRGEDPVAAAAGQAFLVGPGGEFIAVVSGRFSCFAPGAPRRVEMELYHPVPDGTTVESVVAYPLNDPTSTAGSGDCPG